MRCYNILIVLSLAFLASCNPNEIDLSNKTWIDLTHPFNEETLHWPTAEPFQFDTVFADQTDMNFYYESHRIQTEEHVGTHLDAPIHFYEDRNRTHEIPLEQLIGPAIVIDVREQLMDNRTYRIKPEDIIEWEAEHGEIEDGSILLFNTGFGQYWPDALQYMGTTETGDDALAELSFPGIHHETAEWLVENRDIKAVGIDTASLDYGKSQEFKSHQIFAEQNIPGFENLANLEALPPTGAQIVALPMKIEHGSGGPLRIAAMIP